VRLRLERAGHARADVNSQDLGALPSERNTELAVTGAEIDYDVSGPDRRDLNEGSGDLAEVR